MMKNLIDTWREAWSAAPGTSDPSFPFGLVSLAGGTNPCHVRSIYQHSFGFLTVVLVGTGTSEGFPLNMGYACTIL